MKLLDLIEIIWRNMWKRRTRTIFTMVGVIVGCLSIFMIISITNGFEQYLTTSMQEMMDTSVIQVYPNYQSSEGGEARTELTDEDVTKVEELGLFLKVTPKQYAHTLVQMQQLETYISILAVDDYSSIDENKIQIGRLPNTGTREIIIGYEMAKELLGYSWDQKITDQSELENLIGQKIKVGGGSSMIDDKGNKISMKKFSTVIVGVFSSQAKEHAYGAVSSSKFVKTLLRSEIDYYATINPEEKPDMSRLKKYDSIDAKVTDVSLLADAESQLKEMGYQISSAKEFEQQTKLMLLGVNTVLGALAGISLFVSALGITNTMDMAIYERNKEIGIIKVIGGSVNDVIKIFVGEACAISLLGGSIAIVLGFIFTFILNVVGESITADLLGQSITQIAIPTVTLVTGILIFCFVVGFLAGIIPAKKAAKTDIITAIK